MAAVFAFLMIALIVAVLLGLYEEIPVAISFARYRYKTYARRHRRRRI